VNSRAKHLLACFAITAAGAAGLNLLFASTTLGDGWRSTGAMGGFRAIAADVNWLRTYQAWRTKDEALTETLIRRTLAWDPQSDLFWINGARIMANDFPAWRMEREPAAPRAVHDGARRAGARAAISLLQEGLRQRGPRAALWCEIAAHQWHGLGDLESAASSYFLAALLPDAPWHAGRLRAEALLRLGRREEAKQWLRFYAPLLPTGDPAAQRGVVEMRLAELENEAAKQ